MAIILDEWYVEKRVKMEELYKSECNRVPYTKKKWEEYNKRKKQIRDNIKKRYPDARL